MATFSVGAMDETFTAGQQNPSIVSRIPDVREKPTSVLVPASPGGGTML